MDFGLSIEKENNDEEYKVEKKKGNLKKLTRSQNKENEIGRDVACSIVGVKQTLWADAGRQKSIVVMNQSPLIYQQCLQSSTAESHEYLKLELPGVEEPPVSSSVARSCATMVP